MSRSLATKARRPTCGVDGSGFSLLEVMIALLLLAFCMLGVGAAQLHSMHFGADSDDRSQAMYLAEDMMTRFMALSPTETTPTPTNMTLNPPNCPIATPCQDQTNPILLSQDTVDTTAAGVAANVGGVGETTAYNRSWTIVSVTPQPGITMFQITVTVSWNPTPGKPNDTSVSLVGFK